MNQTTTDNQAKTAAIGVVLLVAVLIAAGAAPIRGRLVDAAPRQFAATPMLPVLIVPTATAAAPERQEPDAAPQVAAQPAPTAQVVYVYVEQPAPPALAQPEIEFKAPVMPRDNGAIGAMPAPQSDVNDPSENGGNVAPEGCPFPIINGVCGNGQPTPKPSIFGGKAKP